MKEYTENDDNNYSIEELFGIEVDSLLSFYYCRLFFRHMFVPSPVAHSMTST